MDPGVKFIGVYGPLVLLIALAWTFFGSLAVAATSFTGGYDWRYKVMSSLASPRENPQAYRVAAGGMAASGVFLALLGLCIRTSPQGVAPSKWTNAACLFFVIHSRHQPERAPYSPTRIDREVTYEEIANLFRTSRVNIRRVEHEGSFRKLRIRLREYRS
jgi:hypothetical protein